MSNNETIEAINTYFKGVKSEWGRITWPQRQQVIAETVSVVVIMLVFTITIYSMDIIFKGLLSLINTSM